MRGKNNYTGHGSGEGEVLVVCLEKGCALSCLSTSAMTAGRRWRRLWVRREGQSVLTRRKCSAGFRSSGSKEAVVFRTFKASLLRAWILLNERINYLRRSMHMHKKEQWFTNQVQNAKKASRIRIKYLKIKIKSINQYFNS